MSVPSKHPRLVQQQLELAPIGDARQVSDRRHQPTAALSRYTFVGGRRRGARRADGHDDATFVDLWGPGLFATVCAIIALNFLDAWFTVFMLSHGAVEMNPLIDFVLQQGFWPFILTKSAGIGACVAVLTIASGFRVARFGLALVLVGYLALLGWHMHLLSVLGF